MGSPFRDRMWRRKQGEKKVERMVRAMPWLRRDREWLESYKKRLLHTRVGCSCAICDNKRIWAGRTPQERKFDDEFSNQTLIEND